MDSDDIEKTLDLNAGKDQGRIYRITKEGIKVNFDVKLFQTQEGLIKSLTHPNQWVRNTAHRLLQESPLDGTTEIQLKQLLVSENVLGRLHASWLLSRLREDGRHMTDGELYKLMNDTSPAIREAALVISESLINYDWLAAFKIIGSISDSNERVQMQAILTASLLDRNAHRFNEYEQELLTKLLRASTSKDPWVIAAITLAANEYAPDLLAKILTNSNKNYSGEILNSLAIASGQSSQSALKVLKTLSASEIDIKLKSDIIKNLTRGLKNSDGKTLESSITALEKSGNAGLISELAMLRSKLKLSQSPEFLKFSRVALNKVLDSSLTDSVRLQQLALIELLPYKEKASVLFQCLNHTEPLKLQEGALRQLANYPDKEIGKRVVVLWSELSPQTRRYASDLLLYIEVHHDALLTGLETGAINIGEMNFDLERRRQLLWWTDNENTKRRAEKLFSDSGVTNRQEAIDKMKPALSLTGSANEGIKVFDTVCSNCHQFGNKGVVVGPTLTEIGRKSKETLLHDILDPNAAADPNYINHRLELNDGRVQIGIVASETDQSVTIKKMGGESITLNKAEVKSFRSLGTSLMMEGLEGTMTTQEMADLLAFLQNGIR